ncbi:MAG TPA: hypothetical protein ENK85_08050 [Saprospiraceae bacterium]|nr:hypothetical protein [Saprospiraceae bacterium]
MAFLYILLIITVTVGLSFILLNIRHIITGQQFRGTCASASPFLKDQLGDCSCGAEERAACTKTVHDDELAGQEYEEITAD